MMKKPMYYLSTCILIFSIGLLFYRNHKIQCMPIDADYQAVMIHPGFLIEEPVQDFVLTTDFQISHYYITTDSYTPILALYNRHAVQVFTYAYIYHRNALASAIQIIETNHNSPVEFSGKWTLLKTSEKSSLSYSEDDQYKYYQILLEQKEIRISFSKRNDSEFVESEIIECIEQNYQRLSQ